MSRNVYLFLCWATFLPALYFYGHFLVWLQSSGRIWTLALIVGGLLAIALTFYARERSKG